MPSDENPEKSNKIGEMETYTNTDHTNSKHDACTNTKVTNKEVTHSELRYKHLARKYYCKWKAAKTEQELRNVQQTISVSMFLKPSEVCLSDQNTLIGKGTFGKVYSSTYRGIKVAVKTLHINSDCNKMKLEVFREAKTLLSLPPHEGFPILLGIFIDEKPYRIVTNLIQFDTEVLSLNDFLNNTDKTKAIDSIQWHVFMAKISKAMDHMHRHDYLHNDLHCRNIVIGNEFNPVIIDFGLSCKISLGNKRNYQNIHSYLAPEVNEGTNSQSVYSDVYSLCQIFHTIIRKSTLVCSLIESVIHKCTTASPYWTRPSASSIGDKVEGCICLQNVFND